MTVDRQRLSDQILTFLREVAGEPLTANEIAANALPPIRSFVRGSHVIEEWSPGTVVLPYLQVLRAEGKVSCAGGRWWHVDDPCISRIVAELEASLGQQQRAPEWS